MSIDYAELARLARKGRRAESRGKFAGGCLTYLATVALLAAIKGALFMFACDIAHNHWWPAIPEIGFWWSALLMLAVPFGGSSSSKSS